MLAIGFYKWVKKLWRISDGVLWVLAEDEQQITEDTRETIISCVELNLIENHLWLMVSS